MPAYSQTVFALPVLAMLSLHDETVQWNEFIHKLLEWWRYVVPTSGRGRLL